MGKRTIVNEDISNEAHEATLKLMSGVGSYFAEGDSNINEIIFVPVAILSRIVRGHEATLALLKDAYVSEAAIVTLATFELRVDLLDVARDIKRATAWVEHSDRKQKLGKMKPTLDGLFGKVEADRMYYIFSTLSGIKHGNPRYSELAFPITMRRGMMTVTTGPIETAAAHAFSRSLFAYSTYQLVWAAQVFAKFVARYAFVEPSVLQEVQSLYLSLKKVEIEFWRLCRRKVESHESFFDMKKKLGKARGLPRNINPSKS